MRADLHQYHAQAGRAGSGGLGTCRCCISSTPPRRRSRPPARGGRCCWRRATPWNRISIWRGCGSCTASTRSCRPTDDRAIVHDIIFDELCCRASCAMARSRPISISSPAARLEGADSVILGCTEIGLLIGSQHVDLPTFDSTLLHADAAVDFALDPEAIRMGAGGLKRGRDHADRRTCPAYSAARVRENALLTGD